MIKRSKIVICSVLFSVPRKCWGNSNWQYVPEFVIFGPLSPLNFSWLQLKTHMNYKKCNLLDKYTGVKRNKKWNQAHFDNRLNNPKLWYWNRIKKHNVEKPETLNLPE